MSDQPVSKYVLQVEDLRTEIRTKVGAFAAVDGVSFDLKRGETLGLVGESGSGKSLTGLSLLRLVPEPAARIIGGRVLLNGEDLLQKTEQEMRLIRRHEISMIPQDPQTSLNPVFKIGEQLIEALHPSNGESRPHLVERAVEALRGVRLASPEQRMQNYPHQLSGGMKQRVVSAIAMSGTPQVLIADEPTTALDVTVQAQLLRLLRSIQRETGLAIIFITHDLGIIASMCDRVMVMYAGRIVETGTVEAIFDNPSHPYTEALLKSVPTIDRKVDRLYSIDGQPPALWDLPTGCRFAPRCPYAVAACETYPPSFPAADVPMHDANCWRIDR